MQLVSQTFLSKTCAWIYVIGLLLCLPCQLRAQMQQTSCQISTRGSSSETLDITFLVECGSAEASGVLHYDVVSAAGPSIRDRQLDIIFAMAGDQQGQYSTLHRTRVLLKEGTASVQGSTPFVMSNLSDSSGQRLQFWNVSVWEDDRNIEAVRGIQTSPGAAYTPARLNPGETHNYMLLQRSTQTGAVLRILKNGQGFGTLPASGLIGSSPQGGVIQETPVFDLARDVLRTTCARHVASLPESWFYYLQYRYVTLDREAFAEMQTERPLAAEAIKNYVAAGGILMLFSSEGTGRDLIEKWLLKRDVAEQSSDNNWEITFPNRLPRFKSKTNDADPTVDQNDTDPALAAVLAEAEKDKTLTCHYVRGRIFCLNADNSSMSARIIVELPSTVSAVGLATSNIYDENWSMRNMIASVGKPPVWTFCAIILLFAAVLGPGLLIVTGWIGRRSLLILLVPLVSLGATLAIVAYEVLHEGFGTYARVTSVLTIDQESGDGFVWSRQSFFSGWPPREGLSIPNHVFCRMVNAYTMGRPSYGRNSPAQQYTVTHESERSVWSGVLPSREQRQFLIGHPVKTSMPIEVKTVDAQHISLRNLTGTSLPFVVLRDGKDGYYFAENVAADGEIELESQPFDDIAGSLSRMRSEYVPALPPELRSMGWIVNPNQSNIEIIDQTWAGALAEQAAQSTIKPFGFATVIRKCDDIFVPLKATSQESLTLVTGRTVW